MHDVHCVLGACEILKVLKIAHPNLISRKMSVVDVISRRSVTCHSKTIEDSALHSDFVEKQCVLIALRRND